MSAYAYFLCLLWEYLAATRTSRSSSSKVRHFDDEYSFSALTPLYRRRLSLSGAWQFISGLLLKDPSKARDHERADDLESIFYVLVYVAFRYHESSLSHDVLAYEMDQIFDQYDIIEGVHSGGGGKWSFLSGSGWTLPPNVVTASFPVALARLINKLRNVFVKRYTIRPQSLDCVDPADRDDLQEEWDRYNADQERARSTLSTSDEVIAIFKRFLDMPHSDWEEGRPYMDRLDWQWIGEETMQSVNVKNCRRLRWARKGGLRGRESTLELLSTSRLFGHFNLERARARWKQILTAA